MDEKIHVAIIMDGNGRWAKAQGKPRTYGHSVGADNVETITRAANDLGVSYLTLYAFSTENWKRPASEVSVLMKLFVKYLERCHKLAEENNIRVRIIGDKSGLSKRLQKTIRDLEEDTAGYDGMCLYIAMNYGGRDEMIRAIKAIKEDTNVSSEDISEETFSNFLDTQGIPDPDILIRTGGEKRLSNFLLWQVCYSELFFSDKAWPEFDSECLRECIDSFKTRNRRFGNV